MQASKKFTTFLLLIAILFSLGVICEQSTESENKEPGYYVGSSESDVFHLPSCRYVDQILPENKITFSTRQEAIDAGYRACLVCKP